MFFIRKCIMCGAAVKYREPIALCQTCAPKCNAYGQMVHKAGPAETAYSVLPYQGKVQLAIRKLKYRNMKYLADTFAALMLERAQKEKLLSGVDLITCVPMHKNRDRYYNQAEAIARSFSRQSGIDINCSLLVKVKDVAPFTGLTLAERQASVRGAYAFNNRFDVRGKSVLLIDDTYTSGTTVGECAKMLRMYGARRVTVLTACYATGARVIHQEKFPAQ